LCRSNRGVWRVDREREKEAEVNETRLTLVAPDLVVRLKAASAGANYRIARRLAQLALWRVGVVDARVQQALTLEPGSSSARRVRPEIEELVEELDSSYFELGDRLAAGTASEASYLRAFSAARAVNAALCALADDPFSAACEAAYEALAAIDDIEMVRREVDAELRIS
jgi:hypothetical protein